MRQETDFIVLNRFGFNKCAWEGRGGDRGRGGAAKIWDPIQLEKILTKILRKVQFEQEICTVFGWMVWCAALFVA